MLQPYSRKTTIHAYSKADSIRGSRVKTMLPLKACYVNARLRIVYIRDKKEEQ